MKTIRFSLILIAAAMMIIGLSSVSEAFHEGGVARCSGCHTMHNSNALLEDTPLNPDTPIGTAGPYLLIRNDQSSTCLSCHHSTGTTPSSFRVSSVYTTGVGPSQMTPGGDFGWIGKDFSWSPRPGVTETSPGYSHGHNIIAASFAYVQDARHTHAPGGTYPSNKMQCISCHDPHGTYRTLPDGTEATTGAAIKESGSYGATDATYAVGAYRLLGGVNYEPKSAQGFAFANRTPVAVAPSTYNRAETTADTRVAYGQGMAEWCSNCHGGFHNDNYPTNLRHPAGNNAKLTPEVTGLYNSYKKSGDLTGDQATSYWSLVPFEWGTNDKTVLLANSGITGTGAGPSSGTENVSCITCHRAHATGWESSGRWNFRSDFLVYSGVWPGSDNGTPASYAQGRTAAETSRAYYDRSASNYAGYQRSFCNKCHAKD